MGMGGRYYITKRGKDEEIAHSTHLSRSMGEGIRKEWNIYLSIGFLGKGGGNVQVLRTNSPKIGNKMFQFSWIIYVPYQKRTYFWKSNIPFCFIWNQYFFQRKKTPTEPPPPFPTENVVVIMYFSCVVIATATVTTVE